MDHTYSIIIMLIISDEKVSVDLVERHALGLPMLGLHWNKQGVKKGPIFTMHVDPNRGLFLQSTAFQRATHGTWDTKVLIRNTVIQVIE